MALFSRYSVGLQTIYSDLKRRASEQPMVLVGTPGSVGERDVHGKSFLYRQFYDARGKKAADYLGPADDAGALERAKAVREAIEVTNGLLGDARLLAREGYVRVQSRTNAIVASLAGHGLFRAGAVLVGSHAFGALLNDMGIRSGAHLMEDIDVARFSYKAAQPHLAYLLGASMDAIVIGRKSVVAVRVPRPERLALHTLCVSPKDVHQGAVLMAALAENDSGALEDAFGAFPKSARAKLRLGLKQARTLLLREAHERAVEVLEAML